MLLSSRGKSILFLTLVAVDFFPSPTSKPSVIYMGASLSEHIKARFIAAEAPIDGRLFLRAAITGRLTRLSCNLLLGPWQNYS